MPQCDRAARGWTRRPSGRVQAMRDGDRPRPRHVSHRHDRHAPSPIVTCVTHRHLRHPSSYRHLRHYRHGTWRHETPPGPRPPRQRRRMNVFPVAPPSWVPGLARGYRMGTNGAVPALGILLGGIAQHETSRHGTWCQQEHTRQPTPFALPAATFKRIATARHQKRPC